MKKFIFWILRVTGWEDDLRAKYFKEIGRFMHSDSWWWTGRNGRTEEAKMDTLKAFQLYAKDLLRGAYPNIDRVREEVYKEYPEGYKENIK